MTDPTQKLRDLLNKGVDRRIVVDEVHTITDERMNTYLNDVKEAVMTRFNKPQPKPGVPYQGPTLIDHLVSDINVEVHTFTDGTTTEVFILDPDDAEQYLGRGVARRRKGDRRDIEVGYQIGLARALRNLADELEADSHR